MKLALLAQAYLYDKTARINGTLVQLHNLAYGFKEASLEVHYIASTKDKAKLGKEIIDGIHFHWIQAETSIFSWKKMMSFYTDVLVEVKPDALYVRGRNVMQYVAGKYAKKYNIPYVWATNGDDSAEFWKNIKRLGNTNKPIYKKCLLWPIKAYEDCYINKGMKMANKIINQSEYQQKETKRILKKEGIILPSYFIKDKGANIKENKILWLANLSPNKQPHLFIELINGCSLNGWKAILGGGTLDKKYESKIISLAKEQSIEVEGKIDFKDSFRYYKSSRIYINTSKLEADGLPNAFIQSWLSGAVVLSLNHDPNNWMETYNIGFCTNGDIKALKEKLQLLINEPKRLEIMSANAVEFAEKIFTNQSIIQEYITLFKNTSKRTLR
ncbi:glycosyltransferase family 4 protein [Flavivirga aquimarina]|uniref:Glycosyltransferase family 4 protein n=1 Tax=Flavivirga aquimarina TaxID=2027862 RepID=A0ABT8W753_9FLAO|nr:glycosyltransferase family 4 protein [Flavivirga aquimarina]MDO5968902.1 glycosyltransferase family 4 protein [Flavivirga aquimarina]